MNILKYPTLSERCHRQGTLRSALPGSKLCERFVEEAEMRRMKLRQQVAHGLFKGIRRTRSFNQWPVAFHGGLPIGVELFRR